MNWNLIRHFKKSEWGQNADLVHPDLIFLLDEIRHQYDKKCQIHCAYATGGHSGKSWHYPKPSLGNMCGAVDFHFEDENYTAQFDLIRSFDIAGGIGYYNPTIWNNSGWHIDIRPTRLYWTERNGVYVYDLNAVLEDCHDASNA